MEKPREDQSRPSEEERLQRSRDLVNTEVRRVSDQAFGTPSRETQGTRKKVAVGSSSQENCRIYTYDRVSGFRRLKPVILATKAVKSRGMIF